MSSPSPGSISRADAEQLARQNLAIVARGDLAAADANVTPDFRDHQAGDAPESARGPEAFKLTIAWLHRAFTDMHFEIHQAIVDGDSVALYVTFHAKQDGPFVIPGGPARGDIHYEATGRTFRSRAVHMFRIANGKICEHDALRDDLAMAMQLGWIRP
jgi:ketosteroid isomerase-like protein